MTSITQVAQAMLRTLTEVAETAAQESGFVQRESTMGGAEFAQTLSFGWLSNPQATLEELAQTAATVGVRISPQGLDQRFTESGAACLKKVLDEAVTQLIQGDAPALPILKRFTAVYIQDSSVVDLPEELMGEWQAARTAGTRGKQPSRLKYVWTY